MDAAHFTYIIRSLAATPSRRVLARALAGSALAGALSPLLGLADVDAKRHKKKKRRRKKRRQKNQPFCAGKDTCVALSPVCGDWNGIGCTCYVTAESGKPFCGADIRLDTCSGCLEGETCVDRSGPDCNGTTACVMPCPNPL